MELPVIRHATIEDIPRSVEGTHRGIGLGQEFLRQIHACPLVISLIDGAGSDRTLSSVEDVPESSEGRKVICTILPLSSRQCCVVANKNGFAHANEESRGCCGRERISKIQHLCNSGREGERDRRVLKEALAERMTADKAIRISITGTSENL